MAATELCRIITESRARGIPIRLTHEFWERLGVLVAGIVRNQYPALYELHGGDDYFCAGPSIRDWNHPFTNLMKLVVLEMFHPVEQAKRWDNYLEAYNGGYLNNSYLISTISEVLGGNVEQIGTRAYRNTRRALVELLASNSIVHLLQTRTIVPPPTNVICRINGGVQSIPPEDCDELRDFITARNPLLCSHVNLTASANSDCIDVNNHEELEAFFRVEVGFGELGWQNNTNSFFRLLIMYHCHPRLVADLDRYCQRFGQFRPRNLMSLMSSLAQEYDSACQAPVEDLLTTYNRQDQARLNVVLVTLFERWKKEPGRGPVDTAFADFFLRSLAHAEHPSAVQGEGNFNINELIRKTGFSREALEASRDRLLLYAQKRGDWVVSWLERHTQYGEDEGFDD